jgi:NodT family efflux transporter outer membrane factor (OMF) lipoprotein
VTRATRRIAARVLALAGLALASACTVGPNFAPPAPPAADRYTAAADPVLPAAHGPQAAIGDGPAFGWWQAFGSPELDATVAQALATNHSLAASNATLERSRDLLRAAVGRTLPQLDGNARFDREQINLAGFGFEGAPGTGAIGNPLFDLYSVGGGITYDLDLFGGLRRGVEQTAAQAEAQQRQTEAAHLAISGRVVAQALTIARIHAQIDTANTIIADDRRNYDLTQARRTGGEGTLVEVLNAQSQLTNDQGRIPPLEQALAEARHMLAILIGVTPDMLGPTGFSLATLHLPDRVPVALPSALIHVRPDIRQAEANLHASTAAIGVAQARLYPDIMLGANVTQGAPGLDDLLKNTFRGYDLFAALSAPIFHGGTLQAQRNAAIAQAKADDETYRQTVIEAFGQVADLLTALANDQRAVENQHDATDVAQRSAALSRRSFEVGSSGILQVLDTERLYQQAQAALVDARAQQLIDVARLYVATAGGWTGTVPVATAAR